MKFERFLSDSLLLTNDIINGLGAPDFAVRFNLGNSNVLCFNDFSINVFQYIFFSPVAPTNLDVVGETHSPPKLETGVVDL